ncbi:MAG TPA: hypothetical protein VMA73_00480 [Streptosporangiaceae bacterium]|nr:hypothetical protein [Streptosporangiaceae bacterium]
MLRVTGPASSAAITSPDLIGDDNDLHPVPGGWRVRARLPGQPGRAPAGRLSSDDASARGRPVSQAGHP